MKYLARSLLGLCVIFAGCTTSQAPKNLDTFAQCLTEKGAIMYGAKTCPHCLQQKKMFGDSFSYVTYVECTQEAERCGNELKGNVPAWKFADGELVEGLQSLEYLAEKTHCQLP